MFGTGYTRCLILLFLLIRGCPVIAQALTYADTLKPLLGLCLYWIKNMF